MPPFAANWAFFLDLDGTLLEIAETPDAVGIGPDEKRLVEKLVAGAGGAVAVISGRALPTRVSTRLRCRMRAASTSMRPAQR